MSLFIDRFSQLEYIVIHFKLCLRSLLVKRTVCEDPDVIGAVTALQWRNYNFVSLVRFPSDPVDQAG